MNKESEETMNILKATLAEKQFGQYMQLSAFMDRKSEIYEHAVREMSKSIMDALIKNQHKPLPESVKVFIRSVSEDPLCGYETIGAKIRSVIDDDPAHFIIFAVHMMEEAWQKANTESRRANDRDKRYLQLLEVIATAKNMASLRRSMREIDDDSPY